MARPGNTCPACCIVPSAYSSLAPTIATSGCCGRAAISPMLPGSISSVSSLRNSSRSPDAARGAGVDLGREVERAVEASRSVVASPPIARRAVRRHRQASSASATTTNSSVRERRVLGDRSHRLEHQHALDAPHRGRRATRSGSRCSPADRAPSVRRRRYTPSSSAGVDDRGDADPVAVLLHGAHDRRRRRTAWRRGPTATLAGASRQW